MLTLPTDTIAIAPPDAARPRRPLLSPLPDPGHFLLVMDNTGLDKIKRCHAMAWYYHILCREPHARNAALAFGGAIHEGLKELFFGFNEHQQDQAVLRYFTENPAPPDEYRTPTCALEVLKHYRVWQGMPGQEWEILSDGVPLIERAFELPLGVLEVHDYVPMPWLNSGDNEGKGIFCDRIHVAWSGRIDLVAKVHDRTRVVDHKTSSIDGDQFIRSFDIASQTVGYVWAAQKLWPDMDVSGFALNVIRLKKPGLGQGLMSLGPRGGEPPLKFFRAFFDYSPPRTAEWQRDTLATISDFLHSVVRGHYPLNDRACFDKFGQCPYHDVCTLDEVAVRRKVLESDMFKKVSWNPVH